MSRLLVSVIFTAALGGAGWLAGTQMGSEQQAQLLAIAGALLAIMILAVGRSKAL